MKVLTIISIFIIISIIQLSKQQNIECETVGDPSEVSDCSQYNSEGMYADLCCFYKSTSDSKNKCVSVPYSAFLNYAKYDYKNETLYEITCDYQNNRYKKSPAVLTRCGEDIKNPSMKKCKSYSSYVNSCCYYSGDTEDNEYGELFPNTTERGCYWLGAKYKGKISWGGMYLKCSSGFLNLEKWSLVIFTFTILNILF